MAAGIEFITRIERGRMLDKTRHKMLELFAKLEGKRVKIRITRVQKKRSLQQNRFYWGVVIPIILQMFHDAGNETNSEEVHEYLKKYVWGWTRNIHTPDGVVEVIANSSTQLSTTEWEEKIDMTRAWASHFGYIIPLPNEGDDDGNDEEAQD